MGLGDNVNRNIPTLIPLFNNIIEISAGGNKSLLLDNQGHVYSFGFGSFGNLGLGKLINEQNKNIPTLIPGLDNIIRISTGAYYSLVLNNRGQVYAFGGNEFGQLGVGDHHIKNIPTLILGFDNIIEISAGNNFTGIGRDNSLLLDDEGHVYTFGYNCHGWLGLGNSRNTNVPTKILILNNIIQIAACGGHSLVLNNRGKIYSFGCNTYGQLGLGHNEDRNIPTLIPDFNIF